MQKFTYAVLWVALGLVVSASGRAQSSDDNGEVGSVELEQARTEMETARRQLERAARTIAVQARVPGDVQERYATLANFYGFGGQGQLGATIVDADNGALVTRVTPGGGADEAGIRVGDVIQSIGEVEVAAAEGNPTAAVIEQLRQIEPGSTVAVAVERGGQTLSFEVVTAERPGRLGDGLQVFSAPGSTALRLDNLAAAPFAGNRGIVRTLGFAVSPWGEMALVALSEGLGRYFDTSEGLLVVRGPADDAIDIQDGDVILAISGRTPNSPQHAIRILSSFEGGETIEFSIMRDGRRQTIEHVMSEPTFDRALPAPPAPVPVPD